MTLSEAQRAPLPTFEHLDARVCVLVQPDAWFVGTDPSGVAPGTPCGRSHPTSVSSEEVDR